MVLSEITPKDTVASIFRAPVSARIPSVPVCFNAGPSTVLSAPNFGANRD